MQFPLTEVLIDEASRYRLRSACGDCLFFIPAEGVCAHGWPTDAQRWDVVELARARPGESAEAPFCKEFELG